MDTNQVREPEEMQAQLAELAKAAKRTRYLLDIAIYYLQYEAPWSPNKDKNLQEAKQVLADLNAAIEQAI